MSKKQFTAKKFIIFSGILGLFLVLVPVLLVIIIDPFFMYHKPLDGFPYKVDNQLSQNAGMAKTFEYDSILTGSSMVSNFDLDKFDEILGKKVVKLNYNGAYPKDLSNILEYVFDHKDKVDTVFYGMDVYSFNADTSEIKFPIPEYLYDDRLLNDVSYLFNKDVLIQYIIEPLTWPSEKTELSKVYMMEYADAEYSRERVLEHFTPNYAEPLSDEEYAKRIENVNNNLDENLLVYVEAHPETEFVIFYPPYSILYWYNRITENKLELSLEEYLLITKRLLEYENVHVFCFSGCEDYVTDLGNYVDYIHQHSRVNDYIAECLCNGENELTPDNYEEIIRNMFSLFADYDYAGNFGL